MNNSIIHLEEPHDEGKVKTQEREASLVKTIEAIQRIKQSQDWSTLKTEIFDGLPSMLRKSLLSEAKKEDPNTNLLNRITGELKWAERFSDLEKLENTLRVELKAIRIRLYGKTE